MSISPRLLALLCAAFLPALIARGDGPAKSEGTLYFLSVTVNQEGIGKPGPLADSFNWTGVELATDFKRLSKDLFKEVRTVQIGGSSATRQRLFGALNNIKAKAGAGDVFVLYLGMHGGTDPKDGWAVGLAGKEGVTGKEIKELLAQFKCQIICVVETCGSGGFARPHKNDIPLPGNTTALCCCKAKGTATNELDMAFGEAIQGRADFDRNGLIQLDEITKYVKLRYEGSFGKDGTDCVIVKADAPIQMPLTKVDKDMAAIVHDGMWYSAILEGKDGDQYKVRVTGHNNGDPAYGWFVTDKVKRDAIVLPGEGHPLIVEQGGAWYCARQIGTDGKNIKVKYVGYDEEETVEPSRVKYPAFIDPTVEPAKTKKKTGRRGGK